MAGKTVGYVRVSTVDQNIDRQLAGVEVDRTFTDYKSGKNTDRPALQEMLSYLRDGDTVVVHSIDRLARTIRDLYDLVTQLIEREIDVKFLREGLHFSKRNPSPTAMLQLGIFGVVAQFERDMLLERQREGIAVARAKAKYSGRERILSDEHVLQIIELVEAKKRTIADISRDCAFLGIRFANGRPRTKISRAVLFDERQRYVRAHPEIVGKYPGLGRLLGEDSK